MKSISDNPAPVRRGIPSHDAMKEERFYGPGSFDKAIEFLKNREAEGFKTCSSCHPKYGTQLIRYWK